MPFAGVLLPGPSATVGPRTKAAERNEYRDSANKALEEFPSYRERGSTTRFFCGIRTIVFLVKKNLSISCLLYTLLAAACITAGEQDFSLSYFNPLYPLNPYHEKDF